MYRLNNIFPQSVILQLYYALVHPILSYGLIIWRSTFSSYLQKLIILQNKAIRCVSGANYRQSAKPLPPKLQILMIEDLYKYKIAKVLFNWNRNKTPSSFADFFVKISQVSIRTTKKSSNLQLYTPDIDLTDYKDRLSIRVSRYGTLFLMNWKSLSENLFKKHLKKHFLSYY